MNCGHISSIPCVCLEKMSTPLFVRYSCEERRVRGARPRTFVGRQGKPGLQPEFAWTLESAGFTGPEVGESTPSDPRGRMAARYLLRKHALTGILQQAQPA